MGADIRSAKIRSAVLAGVEALPVVAEVDLVEGLPSRAVVGMAEASARSRRPPRMRTAT